VVPLPASKILKGKLDLKCCQQYAIPDFEENIVLLDTGHAKLMTPFFPWSCCAPFPALRTPVMRSLCGGLGNSIRYVGMAPRDNGLKVEGVENLFCAGEKAGLLVGHTEAICTGTLAGYNAVKSIRSEKRLVLPSSLTVGDAIQFVRSQMQEDGLLSLKYTFSGSVYLSG